MAELLSSSTSRMIVGSARFSPLFGQALMSRTTHSSAIHFPIKCIRSTTLSSSSSSSICAGPRIQSLFNQRFRRGFSLDASRRDGSGVAAAEVSAVSDSDQLRSAREDIRELLRTTFCHPILVRLGWHDAGTYDKNIKDWPKRGGANGSLRFEIELKHAANAGLVNALKLLQPIKEKYLGVTYADLFQLASATAVEDAGGPKIPMIYGRVDVTGPEQCPIEGKLPDEEQLAGINGSWAVSSNSILVVLKLVVLLGHQNVLVSATLQIGVVGGSKSLDPSDLELALELATNEKSDMSSVPYRASPEMLKRTIDLEPKPPDVSFLLLDLFKTEPIKRAPWRSLQFWSSTTRFVDFYDNLREYVATPLPPWPPPLYPRSTSVSIVVATSISSFGSCSMESLGKTTQSGRCVVEDAGPASPAYHLREVFYRMGLNDKEIVALSGAHTLGRARPERSGWGKPVTKYTKDGPGAPGGQSWTVEWLKFDNSYFRDIKERRDEDLLVLPTDGVLFEDPSFKVYAEKYASDQDAFFEDYAQAHAKLSNLGAKFDPPEDCLTAVFEVERSKEINDCQVCTT
ncbi:hypothetical protein Sjap_018304 [Stephania japonica]|uniref:L-ascorbate peroxidase n=1 Tax=Stephania japonica TaxID=461633 RepID=A0AAP0NKZ6_9MAGN